MKNAFKVVLVGGLLGVLVGLFAPVVVHLGTRDAGAALDVDEVRRTRAAYKSNTVGDGIVTLLDRVDVTSVGVAQASSAAVLDSSKGISGLGTISATVTSSGTLSASGIASLEHLRSPVGQTFTTADPNPSRATLIGNNVFFVDPTANAVDLDFSDDTDLLAVDLGTEWKFIVSVGHATQALTVTNGASGVVVTTLNTLGTTCEDTGDYITCTAFALEKVICATVCAD